MAIPTLREVFGFQYTQLGHVVLLLVLFAVCLAQLVIVDEYYSIYFVVGIIIPPVAGVFLLIRMYIQLLKSFIYSIYITLIVELAAYVFHVGLKSTVLVLLFISVWILKIRVWSLNSTLLTAYIVLELVLDVLLEFKLMNIIAQLYKGTPEEHNRINRMLRELRGRRGGAGRAAAAGVVPNEHIANGHVPIDQVANGQIAIWHVPNGQVAD